MQFFMKSERIQQGISRGRGTTCFEANGMLDAMRKALNMCEQYPEAVAAHNKITVGPVDVIDTDSQNTMRQENLRQFRNRLAELLGAYSTCQAEQLGSRRVDISEAVSHVESCDRCTQQLFSLEEMRNVRGSQG